MHVILCLTDYNPSSINRIDVYIATTDLYAIIRTPTLEEEDELFDVCINNIVSEESQHIAMRSYLLPPVHR
ncbi:hypothetical protein Bca4012_025890 [Brassica carinata]